MPATELEQQGVELSRVQRRLVAALVRGGLAISAAAMASALLAAIGYRNGWWDYRLAFALVRWAAWLGVAGSVAAFLGGLLAALRQHKRLAPWAVLGVAIGALTFGIPLYQLQQARTLPPIHDITTDTDNPPRFVAVVPLRQDTANPLAYRGAHVANLQKQGYPDIAPLYVQSAPQATFQRALGLARRRGWEIVAAVPEEGRIEATDTTPLFGFKDDVVIRIAPTDGGSRVDMRSVSRVGVSDLGANAKRIRGFLRDLAA